MDISRRLQKIENDISLILTLKGMSDVDIQNETKPSGKPSRIVTRGFDVPVRDDHHKARTSTSRFPSSGGGGFKGMNCQKSPMTRATDADDAANFLPEVDPALPLLEQADLNQDKSKLQALENELSDERRRRLDIEDSAKLIAIRLNKVEDVLSREKQMKCTLLEGTLQMKNQLHGYDVKLGELQKRIKILQTEKEKLILDLRRLEDIREQDRSDYEDQLHQFETEKDKWQEVRAELEQEVELLQETCVALKTECSEVQKFSAVSDGVYKDEFDKALKASVLEEEKRKKLQEDLHVANQRLEEAKKWLHLHQEKTQFENEKQEAEIKEKDNRIKVLEQQIEKEQRILLTKIEDAKTLVGKTRSLILSLSKEKQVLQCESKDRHVIIRKLQHEKKLLEQKLLEMRTELNSHGLMKNNFWTTQQGNMEQFRQMQHSIDDLTRKVKDEEEKYRQIARSKDDLQVKVVSMKQVQDTKESEILTLKTELKNTSDNLKILQKITEDQNKTIAKYRNDAETSSEAKYKIEMQLREMDVTMKALNAKLNDEEVTNKNLESEVSHLSHKLSMMQSEVEDHDCERFVRCQTEMKVNELERKLSVLKEEGEWKEREKDEAITTSKNATKKIAEMKDWSDGRIQKIKSVAAQEIRKLQEQNQKVDTERIGKIRELESQMATVKNSFSQMQSSYLLKIQQLQSALITCVGPTANANIATSSPFLPMRNDLLSPNFGLSDFKSTSTNPFNPF